MNGKVIGRCSLCKGDVWEENITGGLLGMISYQPPARCSSCGAVRALPVVQMEIIERPNLLPILKKKTKKKKK